MYSINCFVFVTRQTQLNPAFNGIGTRTMAYIKPAMYLYICIEFI